MSIGGYYKDMDTNRGLQPITRLIIFLSNPYTNIVLILKGKRTLRKIVLRGGVASICTIARVKTCKASHL